VEGREFEGKRRGKSKKGNPAREELIATRKKNSA